MDFKLNQELSQGCISQEDARKFINVSMFHNDRIFIGLPLDIGYIEINLKNGEYYMDVYGGG